MSNVAQRLLDSAPRGIVRLDKRAYFREARSRLAVSLDTTVVLLRWCVFVASDTAALCCFKPLEALPMHVYSTTHRRPGVWNPLRVSLDPTRLASRLPCSSAGSLRRARTLPHRASLAAILLYLSPELSFRPHRDPLYHLSFLHSAPALPALPSHALRPPPPSYACATRSNTLERFALLKNLSYSYLWPTRRPQLSLSLQLCLAHGYPSRRLEATPVDGCIAYLEGMKTLCTGTGCVSSLSIFGPYSRCFHRPDLVAMHIIPHAQFEDMRGAR